MTCISGVGFISTAVASFSSAVFGSSDISVTSFDCPGEEAVACATLTILPVAATASDII